MDEHGRRERTRHVPDVIEREHALAHHHVEDDTRDPLAPEPTDPGYWGRLDSGHRKVLALTVAGSLTALALVSVGVYYLLGPASGTRLARVSKVSPIPSEPGTATLAATASVASTTSVVPTSAPVPAATPAGRAPVISYRAGGAIWVSGQYGGNARTVYASTSGVFSLSPDGLTLAAIDGGSGNLSLIDVTSGSVMAVGQAVPSRPDWASDSSFLVYMRSLGHANEVVYVRRNGTGQRVVGQGESARLTVDDRSLVVVPAGGGSAPLSLVALSGGGKVIASVGAPFSAVAAAGDGAYFATYGFTSDAAGARPATVGFVRFDGKGLRTLVTQPAGGDRVSFTDMCVSPDGRWLIYCETGDDGYSRVYAVPSSGGAPVSLTPRLDGYPLRWSADGSELFLVEGNAGQGEATRVSAIRPDGGGHRVVVEGGGI